MNIRNINKSITLFAAATALILSSCVKDDLYDTPHPQHGKITVTADWSARGEGVDVPEKWNVAIGDYTGEETRTVHKPDYLFTPGTYTLLAWNPADGITVSGNTATASYADGQLGWFHTHAQKVTILMDRDHAFTAPLQQQVRQLSVVIKPSGDAAERITGIEASLGGIAETIDFVTGEHSSPTSIKLVFRKSKEGNEWATTIRMLGIAGTAQKLTGTVTFADGNPQPLTFESDLSQALSDFNGRKTVPLNLGGSMITTPSQAGVTATIKDWRQLDDWNVDAF